MCPPHKMLGSFYPVDIEEVKAELSLMNVEEVANGYEALLKEIDEIEEWLSDPAGDDQEICEKLEDWDEALQWRIAYEQLLISTPPLKPRACVGCRDNELNQQGHFGGCLPGWDEICL